MKTRRLYVLAVALLALTACTRGGAYAEGRATSEPPAVEESSAETTPAEASPEPTTSVELPWERAEGDYLKGDSPDVASHLACLHWVTHDEDLLSSDDGLSIGDRVLRSEDPEMRAFGTEAGVGPMVTNPWGMTKLCKAHGYEPRPGSFAEHYSVGG